MNIRTIRCSSDIFYNQMQAFGLVVDGRAGGLIVGRSHSTGDIYMAWQEDDGGFTVSLAECCLEGGEYIVNASAYLASQERINEINQFKEPQPERNHLELSPITRIFNTHAEPNDKLLWIERGQFIVNKHATARHLKELEELNAHKNSFVICDFKCFQYCVAEGI